MNTFFTSPREMVSSLLRNRELIWALTKRDIVSRYRGSMLGVCWSFLHPIVMLMIYTFVFSVVFKARWNGGSDSKSEFALVLFAGLIIFNLFSECITRAPSIIMSNTNYVKKVVFPLEILPWVTVGTALFQAMISLSVWLLFFIIFFGIPHTTTLLLPFVVLPVLFITIGFSWILASIGVYLRDVSQIVGIATTVLMFLSPIFYPISSLPTNYQHLLLLNPLTSAIEGIRDVLFWGNVPNILVYVAYLATSMIFSWLGFVCFQKSRRGFADVL